MSFLKEFKSITRHLDARFEGRELVEASPVDPKRAIAKLLKAAEKELKPLAVSPDDTLSVQQETLDARGGNGPYEVGRISVGQFHISVTLDTKTGGVGIGARSGHYVLDSLGSTGTLKDAAKRLKKPLDFVKERLSEKAKKAAAPVAPVAASSVPGLDLTPKELEVLKRTGHSGGHQSPEVKSLLAKGLLQMDPDYGWGSKKTPSNSWHVSDAGHEYLAKLAGGDVGEKLAAVKKALAGRKTKTGGRLKFDGQSASPYVVIDFEPEYRQRLDHYGSSYDSDGDEQEGWDDEGWEEDYAGPLRKEVEALLKDAGIEGWVVDVGEKGHVSVQLPRRS